MMYIKSQRTVGSLGDADSSAGIFRLALVAFGAYWLYKNTSLGQKVAGKMKGALGAGPKARDALAGLFKGSGSSSGGRDTVVTGKKCALRSATGVKWCPKPAKAGSDFCSTHSK